MKGVYELILLVCLIVGCKPQKGKVAEKMYVDTLKEDRSPYPPIPTKKYKLGDCLFGDTVGSGPQNQQITVYDKQGRLLAVAAKASEVTYFRFYKYLYDRKGVHVGFSTLLDEASDYPFIEDTILPFNEYPYDINSLYYDLCVRKYDDRNVERYHFTKNNQGDIRRVYDPITGKKLEASSDKKIVYKIEEGDLFWASDLRGGDYHLKFYIVPVDSTRMDTDSVAVYEGYEPYVKEEW